MSLSVDARHCGSVYVMRCSGRIVAGEESGALEAAINRGLREFRRLVIDLEAVARLDSSGMGLLMRFLSHTRNRGGDLRLSSPPPFVADLLRVTKLAGVFRIYDSEDEAILSFLKEPGGKEESGATAGPLVLFVDRSPDLCAFVRALLRNDGYEVLSTCRTHDARMLLTATKFDYLILGPDSALPSSEAASDAFKSVTRGAATVQLQPDFKYDDPQRAAHELLRMVKSAGAS